MRTDWFICITGLHDTDEQRELNQRVHYICMDFAGLKRKLQFEEFKNTNLEKLLKVKQDEIDKLKLGIET